jgi:hypothetical protein
VIPITLSRCFILILIYLIFMLPTTVTFILFVAPRPFLYSDAPLFLLVLEFIHITSLHIHYHYLPPDTSNTSL